MTNSLLFALWAKNKNGGGGGSPDFSSIRGAGIDLRIEGGVLVHAEVNREDIAPSDFLEIPFIDIKLSLSDITINNDDYNFGSDVMMDGVSATFYNDQLWIRGMYIFNTPDGLGYGHGVLMIQSDLSCTWDYTEFYDPS